jgi:PAS domain S-box-containing protein
VQLARTLKHLPALAALENRALAVEESLDGMAVLEQGRFTYLNRAHIDMFGYASAAELLGQPWEILYRPEEIAWLTTHAFPQLAQQGFWRGETLPGSSAGSEFVLRRSDPGAQAQRHPGLHMSRHHGA